jgi:CTP:molybdopterin cytidylyltransferase MocA
VREQSAVRVDGSPPQLSSDLPRSQAQPGNPAHSESRADAALKSSALKSPLPVAGLVLAAGGGRRLGGQPKALLRHHGEYLVDRAARVAREGGCDPVICVLGAGADDVLHLARADTLGHAIVNPDWSSGLSSSLRAGLAAVPARCGAVLILLADQPFITAEAVARVLGAHRAGAQIAAAAYAGRRGHPVLVAARHVADVAASATGDGGARDFLRAREEAITLVDCTGLGRPADIDRPADLGLLAQEQ